MFSFRMLTASSVSLAALSLSLSAFAADPEDPPAGSALAAALAVPKPAESATVTEGSTHEETLTPHPGQHSGRSAAEATMTVDSLVEKYAPKLYWEGMTRCSKHNKRIENLDSDEGQLKFFLGQLSPKTIPIVVENGQELFSTIRGEYRANIIQVFKGVSVDKIIALTKYAPELNTKTPYNETTKKDIYKALLQLEAEKIPVVVKHAPSLLCWLKGEGWYPTHIIECLGKSSDITIAHVAMHGPALLRQFHKLLPAKNQALLARKEQVSELFINIMTVDFIRAFAEVPIEKMGFVAKYAPKLFAYDKCDHVDVRIVKELANFCKEAIPVVVEQVQKLVRADRRTWNSAEKANFINALKESCNRQSPYSSSFRNCLFLSEDSKSKRELKKFTILLGKLEAASAAGKAEIPDELPEEDVECSLSVEQLLENLRNEGRDTVESDSSDEGDFRLFD